jgi:AcrR family transcriptional regulator
MSNNVVADHNDVNDYFVRYASTGMTTRPYHHGSLRAALLTAAERTLRERGSDQLSLRELAREIGVSHGAPRRHFADRQALLDALAHDGFVRLGTELRTAVDRAGDSYEERLRAAAAAYVRFATDDAALLELMFAGKHRQEAGQLVAAAERTFSVMLELIAQGQTEGALEPGDPEGVGLLLFATLQGIAALATAGIVEPGRLDELVTDAVARFLRGTRTPAKSVPLGRSGGTPSSDRARAVVPPSFAA